MNAMDRPIVIMAGGTGGHIFPALAVADCLRARDVPVVWLGSRGGMETRLVPESGIPLITLSVKGLRGKGVGTLLLAPFKLLYSVSQALKTMLRYRPRAVLGLGGFAAGPGGIAAWLLRRPLYIHEQNAIPGLTNRWLSRFSQCVMEGFPGSFRTVATGASVVHIGNPVRKEITTLPDTRTRLKSRTGRIRLLILGGSLGALKINQTVAEAVAALPEGLRPEIRHQTGERHLDTTRQHYSTAGVEARLMPFVEDMAQAYGWADLVIARAGALTVSELIEAGVAAILVPYPYAVDDHQTANARILLSCGAARLLPDAALGVESLRDLLGELLVSRDVLLEMGQAAHALKRPHAAETVAGICLGEIHPAHLQQQEASV